MAVVEFLTRQREVHRVVEMRLGSIIGHERVFDHDVFAARAFEAGDVPVVLDTILPAQQQKGPEVGEVAAADVTGAGDSAQVHAFAVVAAGGERPTSRNLVPARNLLSLAGRIVGRGVHRCGIFTPHLALRSLAE